MNNIKFLCTSVALLSLTACASTSNTPDDAKPSSVLVISPAKIFKANDPSRAFEIKADGSVHADGKAVGTVYADGRMVGLDGKLVFSLTADGKLLAADGSSSGSTINADNVYISPGGKYRVSIDATGAIVGGNLNAPVLMTQGCQGPAARTCLVVLGAMVMGRPAPPISPTEAVRAAVPVLTLGAAKFFNPKTPSQKIELKSDGSIVINGVTGAKLHADGRVTNPAGTTLLSLQADGKIMMDGKHSGNELTANQELRTADGRLVTIDTKGMLVGGKPNGPQIQTDGCQGAMKRTCLFLIAVSAMAVNASSTPPATTR